MSDRKPQTAREAYDALAIAYDVFTAHHQHARWLQQIEELAVAYGANGRRALDIACGTGKSFAPLIASGWEVTACDLSPAMVEIARTRHPLGSSAVHIADMCDLPDYGQFDLVTCLDDALNYVIDSHRLRAAFGLAARSLRPGGLYVFDLNTLGTYRGAFTTDHVMERDSWLFAWRGAASEPPGTGSVVTVTLEAFEQRGELWRRRTSQHVQRHYPPSLVMSMLAQEGLRAVRLLGQRPGVILHDGPDESTDTKLLYLAARE